ncbi:RNA-directed DNA polymerase, eukaryota, reverse transcriptase zinc-binding domain protein, partial [Tanacetum coccineum]
VKFYCTIVYASNNGNERRLLWNELAHHKHIAGQWPWLLMGDFNVNMDVSEHSAGGANRTLDMQDFRDTMNSIEVDDIFLIIKDRAPKKKKAFRFSNFITRKEEFMLTVKKKWEENIQGTYMYQFVKKLKRLKHPLNNLSWNKGNVFNNVFNLKEKLKSCQENIDKNPHDKMMKKLAVDTLNEYSEAVKHEISNRFEGEQVADQFVKHFESFLGSSRPVTTLNNDIFINTLSVEEAEVIVREVNDKEIKEALFDIDGDKVSGPDGYSSEFFKKAWEVIGKDFFYVMKEFFSSGRHIQDNILIAQELLRGYNRINGPRRCSMQIDIQKAYDTVNWSFMEKTLFGFGFHRTMINWIMQCITSSKFSIYLNGETHGYFKGGRGLRQGDLISPYLFTLVMEVFNLIMKKNIAASSEFGYHFGCKELKLPHICFVDDLLVLCKGNKESLLVIKQSFKEFGQMSGLTANLGKSIIFFGSIKEEVKQDLLQILPFKCGKLHARYMGVPLLAKKLSVQDCKILIDKVEDKINLINEFDKLFKKFLWNAGDSATGKARVAWKIICRPKEQGGLDHVLYEVGKGNKIFIWYDKWNSFGTLGDVVSQRDLYDARLPMDAKVSDLISDNMWKWPRDWLSKFLNGKTVIWFNQLIPKHGFILWLAIQKRLLTQDRMAKWNKGGKMLCGLCNTIRDSHDHLFFHCDFANKVWKDVIKMSYKFGNHNQLDELCNELGRRTMVSKFGNVVDKLLLAATVYYIWQERNKRIFKAEKRSVDAVSKLIKDCVKSKLMSIQVKKSKCVLNLCRKWDLRWNNGGLIAAE